MTVAAGAVAYSFPSVIVPQNLIVEPTVWIYGDGSGSSYNFAPRGLSYLINDTSRVLQGIRCSVVDGVITVPPFILPSTNSY